MSVRRRPLPTLAWIALGAFGAIAPGGAATAAAEPRYLVELNVGAFEIRDYPAAVVAEVRVSGERRSAANAGFRILARYIFGSNARNQRIPMSAPVVEANAAGELVGPGDSWMVRFFMPPGSTLQRLPAPEDSRVRLVELPAARYAVVRFSGLGHDADVARSTADLRAFIRSHHLTAAGAAFFAGYNPPWTPWFMRRNEVFIPLAPLPKADAAGVDVNEIGRGVISDAAAR